jgi:hypothetical protein
MNWSLIVSVCRDEEVLQRTLLRSPAIKAARRVLRQRGFPTVSTAYNAAIRECEEDVLVFAHPDVYLSEAWYESFVRSMDWLGREDPDWAVAGMAGRTRDGSLRGFAYSTGLGGFIGVPFSEPCEVRTLDEFVFALRRGSGLTFDEEIPGAQSQMCTTDLCLEAERRGLRSYALPCLALHNSNGWSYLPLGFWKCYLYMRKKWRGFLPVEVPYTRLTAGCLPMIKNTVRGSLRWRPAGHRVVTRVSDPVALYERLQRGVLSGFGGRLAPYERSRDVDAALCQTRDDSLEYRS